MNPDTFAALPAPCVELAQGITRALLTTLQHKPDSTVRCCCIGNWTTNQTEFFESQDISAVAMQESANDAHLLAASIDADYLMTVFDLPGPPRRVTIGIETRDGTYLASFPVIRKKPKALALTLGRGSFQPCETVPAPFDRLLPARTS